MNVPPKGRKNNALILIRVFAPIIIIIIIIIIYPIWRKLCLDWYLIDLLIRYFQGTLLNRSLFSRNLESPGQHRFQY